MTRHKPTAKAEYRKYYASDTDMRYVLRRKLCTCRGASLALSLFLLIVVIIISIVILNAALANVGRTKRNMQAEQNYLTVSSAAKLTKNCLGDVSAVYEEKDGSARDYSFSDALSGDNSGSNPFKSMIEIWLKNGGYNNDASRSYTIGTEGSSGSGSGTAGGSSGGTGSGVSMDTVYASILIEEAKSPAEGGDSSEKTTDTATDTSSWTQTVVTKTDTETTKQTGNIIVDLSLTDGSKKSDAGTDDSRDDYLMTLKIPYTLETRQVTVTKTTTKRNDGSTESTETTTTTYTFKTQSASGADNNITIRKGNELSSP